MRDHERLQAREAEDARPAAAAVPHPHAGVLALHRSAGNAAVARALAPAPRGLARQEDQDGRVEVENIGPPVTTDSIVTAHAVTLMEHDTRLKSLERGDRFSFQNWRGMPGTIDRLTSTNGLKPISTDFITGHD